MDALEPLARLSGVHFVALVTADGVPIPVTNNGGPTSHDADRLAAVAQQFMSELVEATAPLTWAPPRWARITSERGGAALLRVRGGSILVLFGAGTDSAALRRPMQVAAECIDRLIERLGGPSKSVDSTPAALPSSSTPTAAEHLGTGESHDRVHG